MKVFDKLYYSYFLKVCVCTSCGIPVWCVCTLMYARCSSLVFTCFGPLHQWVLGVTIH
jgi:hypothetical protein